MHACIDRYLRLWRKIECIQMCVESHSIVNTSTRHMLIIDVNARASLAENNVQKLHIIGIQMI